MVNTNPCFVDLRFPPTHAHTHTHIREGCRASTRTPVVRAVMQASGIPTHPSRPRAHVLAQPCHCQAWMPTLANLDSQYRWIVSPSSLDNTPNPTPRSRRHGLGAYINLRPRRRCNPPRSAGAGARRLAADQQPPTQLGCAGWPGGSVQANQRAAVRPQPFRERLLRACPAMLGHGRLHLEYKALGGDLGGRFGAALLLSFPPACLLRCSVLVERRRNIVGISEEEGRPGFVCCCMLGRSNSRRSRRRRRRRRRAPSSLAHKYTLSYEQPASAATLTILQPCTSKQ